MLITYHKEVPKPDGLDSYIPFNLLCKQVQDKLIELAAAQEQYAFKNNGYYVFLYLDNGDRIDIAL